MYNEHDKSRKITTLAVGDITNATIQVTNIVIN